MSKLTLPNEVILNQVERMIGDGVTVTLKVKGRSMLPFIVGERDSVRLEPLADIAVGDILLAKLDDGNFVIHRAYAIDGDHITLMGDGNIIYPEHCSRSQIIAIVTRVITPRGEINPYSMQLRIASKLWRVLLPLRLYLLKILYHLMPSTR